MIYWSQVVVCVLDLHFTLQWPRHKIAIAGPCDGSILKIIKSLQNYWDRVTDITSFGNRSESSLSHTLNFCLNFVQYRFKNMYFKEHSPCLLRWSCLQTKEGQKRNEFHLVGLRRRQYDPVIIERTIGLVLGPFTALYRSFLKRCTLTNTAVGAIWRALSKPPQRRQGPDPRPIWLLVGTPSALGPELAYRLHVAQPTLMDVPLYFWYYMILLYMFVYHIFMNTLLWLVVWSSVSIRRIIYNFF